MRITFVASILSFFIYQRGWPQSPDQNNEVMKPIRMLFDAMQKGDSALMHKEFLSNVTMNTIAIDKNGKPFKRDEMSIDGFLKAVGSPHAEAFNEMIWDEKIMIDHNFAQVWTRYAFYLGKKLSHCGVDAFHLFKNQNGDWKIFHLADTRQKDGCNVPPKISKQFE